MVANPNNSSPSSGALNGNSGVGASSTSLASAVTLATVASASQHPSQAASMMATATAQLQPPSQPPRQDQQQQPNFAAAVQQLNGHASSLTEGRSVPSPSPSLSVVLKQQPPQQPPTSQQSSHFPGAPMGSSLP